MKRLAKEISTDENLINSLIATSKNKLISQEMLPLNETTTTAKISLAYDALREILEALAIKKGFKVYNHECYTAFLKEIIKNSFLGDDFDEIRKLRNDINYYGKDIAIEECTEVLRRIKQHKKSVEKYLTME